MKKTILSIIILSFLVGGVAFAQETALPDAGMPAEVLLGGTKAGLTPNSPFYFLETIAEEIVTFFTFGDLKKAKRYVALASERVAEAKAMIEKGKLKKVEKTLKRYEKQLIKALSRVEKAKAKGKDTGEAAKTMAEAAHKHLIVLGEVLKKAPEEAKPAIEQAMTVSSKGNERALGALPEKEKDAFGFELLKAECIKAGAPSEICASLKARCKEAGATTSEECERVLSTFRIESSPQRALSEEEMEERRSQGEAEEPALPARRTGGSEAEGRTEEKKIQRRAPNTSKVIIYSTPTCPYCIKAKQWLDENNIEYEDFDVSQNEENRNKLIEMTGRTGVPFIIVGDETVSGFNKNRLSELLGVE